MSAPFPTLGLPMQAIAYPVGLVDARTPTDDSAALATPDPIEIARLRLENAQLQRKVYQKQQQINRLMDHVNRLARVLGQLKRAHTVLTK